MAFKSYIIEAFCKNYNKQNKYYQIILVQAGLDSENGSLILFDSLIKDANIWGSNYIDGHFNRLAGRYLDDIVYGSSAGALDALVITGIDYIK